MAQISIDTLHGEGVIFDIPQMLVHGEEYNRSDLVIDTFDVEGTHYVLVGDSGNVAGTADDDVVVEFYYSKDEIGTENPDESDGVADKYQVTFLFKAEGKGVLAQGTPTKLVKTLMDDNGEYLQSGKASIVADDSVKAEPYTGYEIDEWMSEEFDGLSWTSNPLTTAALSVTGGKTYTFTATFKSLDFNVFRNLTMVSSVRLHFFRFCSARSASLSILF